MSADPYYVAARRVLLDALEDHYWERLSAVPEADQCGWLTDRYGLSWQIVPSAIDDMLRNGTKEQIARVTAALLQMHKFDIAELERAYAG